MKHIISNRVKRIRPFMVMSLLERAKELERQGKSVVHFEIGEPDFNTPNKIVDAAIHGFKHGHTHYTHSLGIWELRRKIADYKRKSRNLRVEPDSQIMVTAGSSPSFFISLAALLNPGDEVIITDPGYPCYNNFVRFFGAVVKNVEIYEKDKFDLNVELLKKQISPRTKVLILNSPSNPTGQIIRGTSLKKIADLAIKHDFYVISDEIYAELTYDGKIAPSISEIPEMKERTIILDGFSKFWAMTGWRLGYMIAPAELMTEMNKVNQNFFICAPSVSQIAGTKAFECHE